MAVFDEALRVSLGETASSADVGVVANNSDENLEDRSGDGYHANSIWTWVSRS